MNLTRIDGHPLPPYWLGTWSLGGYKYGSSPRPQAKRVLELAFNNGLFVFDTAPLYGRGASESLLGHCFKSCRSDIFISTKGGLEWHGNRVQHDGSEKGLTRHLHQSLERLQTQSIDLYQLHWPDPKIPIDESIETLKGFQKKKLIRYWGIGNLTPTQHNALGHTPFIHHFHFSPLHQHHTLLTNHTLNFINSPLEQGLLADPSKANTIGNKDIRHRNPYFKDPKAMAWVQTYHALCEEAQLCPVRATLLWLMCQPSVNGIVIGPRKPHQLEQVIQSKQELDALNWFTRSLIEKKALVQSLMGIDLWEHLHSYQPKL